MCVSVTYIFHAIHLTSFFSRSMSSNYRSKHSIIVLDTPGFQNPSSCGKVGGATFEDLCHNYTQERLQLLFHDSTFTSQQDKYSQVKMVIVMFSTKLLSYTYIQWKILCYICVKVSWKIVFMCRTKFPSLQWKIAYICFNGLYLIMMFNNVGKMALND